MKKSLKFIMPLFLIVVIGVIAWLNKDNITTFIQEKQIANLVELAKEYVSENDRYVGKDVFEKVNKYNFISGGAILVNENNEVAMLIETNGNYYVKTYAKNDIQKLSDEKEALTKFLTGIYFDEEISDVIKSEARLVVSAINMYCTMNKCGTATNIIYEDFDLIVGSTIYFNADSIKKITLADDLVEELELAYESRLYVYDDETNSFTIEENKYNDEAEVKPEEKPTGGLTKDDKFSISMIYSSINNYCAAADLRQQLHGETNPCVDGVTVQEANTMLDPGDCKIINVKMNGNEVDSVTVSVNGKTVVYDGTNYTVK